MQRVYASTAHIKIQDFDKLLSVRFCEVKELVKNLIKKLFQMPNSVISLCKPAVIVPGLDPQLFAKGQLTITGNIDSRIFR